ncbi:carbohydrate-binding protein [Spirilliplanes yamanashiensis]|uniref:GH16 domain-containing protein n=1 Tax=Spirilliplanes yamanashiensis TaxID=42233 RepID=A0A8J4DJQ1_9ACTN|nr:carbohydrate-binding protein [Spirilliplanes yamanashiensis]MDP9815821.1 hypothetical protein [Spirilliplanes yamanashiensis]GIJ04076.1 hypothetical protein Sya03_34280 [Spirilliplanes yamanashiensis]
MGLSPKARKTALGGVVVASAAALTAFGISAALPSSAAVACGTLFDDFNYSSNGDPALGQRGWSIRGQAGGPGVPGATWSRDNVSFPTVDGQKVVQLRSTTNGTAGGTTHAEFSQSSRRFFEGTYMARIKFADAPVSGPDGDIVNQTFYTISPLRYAFDPIYSELDFSEYLPNGGWGTSSATNFQTSWYTYQADPWVADNQHSQQTRSIAGWRDVMATVANGEIKYYIDGQLVGTHSGKVYPRQNMSIDFNQWFIDLTGRTPGATSTWQESIDYVLHVKKEALTPAQAASRVAAYRSSGTTHTDNVTADNACTPGTTPPVTTAPTTRPPTTPPTTPPTQPTQPPTTAPTTAPPTTRPPTQPPTTTTPPPATGQAWAAYVGYTTGQVVTYNGARYQCRQAHTSLPGWEPANVLALWLPI